MPLKPEAIEKARQAHMPNKIECYDELKDWAMIMRHETRKPGADCTRVVLHRTDFWADHYNNINFILIKSQMEIMKEMIESMIGKTKQDTQTCQQVP